MLIEPGKALMSIDASFVPEVKLKPSSETVPPLIVPPYKYPPETNETLTPPTFLINDVAPSTIPSSAVPAVTDVGNSMALASSLEILRHEVRNPS